jgi:Zn-dependent M28 family amino/carboxypeptidase
MGWRELGFFVRGRINNRLAALMNRQGRGARPVPAPLDAVLGGVASPLELARVVEGRPNLAREAAVAAYLTARDVPFERHRFVTFEGRGENFTVDIGSGDRILVLVAHHDAVPGSPGANDNAAAVGILLHLLERLPGRVPPGFRVRLLFTAAEELGYLGARVYAREMPLAGVVGVLSLELCGIGDALAVWDVGEETRFVQRVAGALEGAGHRRDEGYHLVGRIPVFGSDHRAFAAAGVPAYGLTIVPLREAEALRRFVLSPMRSALGQFIRRPPPFDTYHTARDAAATLEPAAVAAVVAALEAIVADLG